MLVGWLAFQLVLLVNVGLTGRWPWHMFARPSGSVRTLMVEARAGEGPWERLPVEEVFRYTRGFTDLRVPHEAKVLRGADRRPERRREFALWMIAQTAPDEDFDEVRLWWSVRGPRGRVREEPLGQWRVE